MGLHLRILGCADFWSRVSCFARFGLFWFLLWFFYHYIRGVSLFILLLIPLTYTLRLLSSSLFWTISGSFIITSGEYYVSRFL
jgi:hypothetical protein